MRTLVDSFGRHIEYLRVSVTDRCDFRCFYCIPKGYNDFEQRDSQLDAAELTRLVRLFTELGVNKVRLTGGEPLVRRDLPQMARAIGALPGVRDLSLSTNASRLAEAAGALLEAGIGRINVSLDSLRPEVFREITGGDLNAVLRGLAEARRVGLAPIKINMVVMRDRNLEEVGEMVDYCLENGFTLRFIETMPVGAAGARASERYVDLEEVRQRLAARYSLESALMPGGGGPARYARIAGSDLKIGFITPMSRHFCDTCNRVRLSAQGVLYLCLGQEDRLELSPLLEQGADDETIKAAISQAMQRKPQRHEFEKGVVNTARLMSMTGG